MKAKSFNPGAPCSRFELPPPVYRLTVLSSQPFARNKKTGGGFIFRRTQRKG